MTGNVGKIRKKITGEQANKVHETFVKLDQLIDSEPKCRNCVLLFGATDDSKNAVVQLFSNLTIGGDVRVLPELMMTADNTTLTILPDLKNVDDPSTEVIGAIGHQQFYENTSGLKILIAAGYHTLTVPEERSKFTEILDSLKSLFVSIAKFQHSIALIVTGTDSQLSTDEIKQQVAASLRELQTQYHLRSSVHQMLLSIFLIERNGNYTRLQVVREEDREALRQLLTTELTFTPCRKSDFQTIDVSENSKSFVTDLKHTVTQNNQRLLDEIFGNVRQTCQDATTNFEKLDALNMQLMQLQNLRRQVEAMLKDEHFEIESFLNILKMNGFEVTEPLNKEFMKQGQRFRLLKSVDSQPTGRQMEFDIFLVKVHNFEFIFAFEIYDVMDRFVNSNFDDILTGITDHFQDIALNSQNLEETKKASADLTEVDKVVSNFTVEKFLHWLPANVTAENVTKFKANLMEQYKFISFIQIYPELEMISEKMPNESDRFLPKVTNFIEKLNSTSVQMSDRIEDLIKTGMHVSAISEAIKEHFEEIIHRAPAHESRKAKAYISAQDASLAQIVTEVEEKPDFNRFNEKIGQWLFDNRIEYRGPANSDSAASGKNFTLWVDNMKPATSHLTKLTKWVRFVDDLMQRLADYDAQKFIEQYEKFNQVGSRQGLTIFLDQIQLVPTEELSDMEMSKIHHLITAAAASNKQESVLCNEGHHLLVQDHFVRLSQVKKFLESCRDTPEIYIFAKHTVFIDEDLDLSGTERSVSMLAPIWNVIGERVIKLDGANGREHPKAEFGVNGLPGEPGGAGGNFLGIGSQFVNGGNLTISSNGGNGGPGQDGGAGQNGVAGQTVSTPEPTLRQSFDENSNCNAKINGMSISGFTELNQTTVDGKPLQHFRLYGTNGTEGSDGGRGGIQGPGGPKGALEIVELDSPSGVKKLHVDGQNGVLGQPGTGGNGGVHGKTLYVTCTSRVLGVWVAKLQSFYFSVVEEILMGKAQDGQNATEYTEKVTLAAKTPVPKIPKPTVIQQFKALEGTVSLNPFDQLLMPVFLENVTKVAVPRERRSPESSSHWVAPRAEAHYGDSTLLLMDLVARKLTKTKPNRAARHITNRWEDDRNSAMDLAYSHYAYQNL